MVFLLLSRNVIWNKINGEKEIIMFPHPQKIEVNKIFALERDISLGQFGGIFIFKPLKKKPSPAFISPVLFKYIF